MAYDKIELTKKEEQLIVFIREEMPFGRCILVTHGGEPKRAEDIKRTKIFGEDKKESFKNS